MDVTYVLLRFPYLTETFIANEIWELKQQNVRVRILSLLEPKHDLTQSLSKQLMQDVQYAPAIHAWQLWWAQLFFLLRMPGQYLALLGRLLRQPYPANFVGLFLKRVFIFLKAVSLAYVLKDTPPKLIHTHFASLSGAASWVISRLLNVPFTVTTHAYDIYFVENGLLCLVATSAAQVVTISGYNKRKMLEMCPTLSEEAISIIHCGISVEQFTPSAANGSQPVSILSVGSLVEKKGYEYLINACRLLKADDIDFRCTIIGGGPETYEQTLKQLVEDSGLENQVVFKGACRSSEVLDAYRQHDLFVLASVITQDGDRDGIPVVLMEAAAMQLPLISTEVSGIPELVRHGETGWLVPERDAPALAEAIRALASDRQLRRKMARNGRLLVERSFDIRQNVAQLVELFRRSAS